MTSARDGGLQKALNVKSQEDIHLHHFIIYGKHYGITIPGGMSFHDCASSVKLETFNFRKTEKFLYEYDFSISPTMGISRYWGLSSNRTENRVKNF